VVRGFKENCFEQMLLGFKDLQRTGSWVRFDNCTRKSSPHRSGLGCIVCVEMIDTRNEIQLDIMDEWAISPPGVSHSLSTIGIKTIMKDDNDSPLGLYFKNRFDVSLDSLGGMIPIDQYEAK